MTDAVARELDARGLLCPLPVLRIIKVFRTLGPGDHLRVRTDDPAAVIDVPHFCHEHGHTLVSATESPEGAVFVIRKNR